MAKDMSAIVAKELAELIDRHLLAPNGFWAIPNRLRRKVELDIGKLYQVAERLSESLHNGTQSAELRQLYGQLSQDERLVLMHNLHQLALFCTLMMEVQP